MAKTSTHTTTKVNGTKRKREDPKSTNGNDGTHTNVKRSSTKSVREETPVSDDDNTTIAPTPKTKKSKPSKSQPTATDSTLTISSLPPTALSQKFTQTIQKHKPNLSPIELEDLTLPASCFLDTSNFESTRDPSNLSLFLTTFTPGGKPKLTTTPSSPSTPHTLILTTSAIRTTHLLRGVRDLGTSESKIAKLFAKHMKLAVMETYVRNTMFGIAAGTPGRVLDLVRGGSLNIEGLKRVVVDGTYVDEKGRGVWGDKETFERACEFVNLEGIKGRLVRGHVQVLVF